MLVLWLIKISSLNFKLVEKNKLESITNEMLRSFCFNVYKFSKGSFGEKFSSRLLQTSASTSIGKKEDNDATSLEKVKKVKLYPGFQNSDPQIQKKVSLENSSTELTLGKYLQFFLLPFEFFFYSHLFLSQKGN